MDLFDAMGRLFTKEEIVNPPSDFILHRFLSSQPEFAIIAADLQLICKDRERCWKIWYDAIPKRKKAPYLQYPAPKKKVPMEVIERYAQAHGLSYRKAEEEIDIIELNSDIDSLRIELGIE